MDTKSRVALSLGSNLGKRYSHIMKAVDALAAADEMLAVSNVYESPAWGYEDDKPYLNLAVVIHTSKSPEELLSSILATESLLGRARNTDPRAPRYQARIIDIDMLLYDDLVQSSACLTLPHPAMAVRPFVLFPLCEIAADWIHPILKKSVSELRSLLKTPTLTMRYAGRL